MKKRILSILLCCVMLVGLLPTAAFAEGSEDVAVCKTCHRSDNLKTAGFVMDFSDYLEGHHQKYLCWNHSVGITCIGEKLYPHTFENEVCTGCGYTCTHSYENGVCKSCGKVCGHSYSADWVTDETSHWHECTECGAKTDEAEHIDADKDHKCDVCEKVLSECADADKDHKCDLCGKVLSEHSGGTATCKDKAKCKICGESYGEKNANNHTDATEWVQTATTHTQKYKCCGAIVVAEENHEWASGVCSECGYGCRHDYEWQSENGQYWQKCKFCNHETAKKDIPTINISGADKVCRTQDYKFSFTLPEGATDAAYGYEFIGLGDGPLTPTVENNLYSGSIKASVYPAEESGFKLIVSAKTADGFEFSAEKTVAIQNAHSGGKATCKDKAKCEFCGESYGELNANNHSDLKHFPAVAATKTAEGNIEYWYCSGCKKYYKDAKATQEITKAQTVTAKLPDDSKSPQTGDNSNLALWIALLFVSGGAAIGTTVVSRKKKYNR